MKNVSDSENNSHQKKKGNLKELDIFSLERDGAQSHSSDIKERGKNYHMEESKKLDLCYPKEHI